jgi:ankyrin repeat protein
MSASEDSTTDYTLQSDLSNASLSNGTHAPQPVTNGAVQTPRDTSQLPPEALDLAARLFDYARAGNIEALTQYVSAGIPPNLTNHAGDTLLMLAAYHNHPETVKMLIEKGADVNSLNDRGQSPLAGAVFKGWDEVIEALWNAGANVDAGHPNARACAEMFRRDRWIETFERGRGDTDSRGDVPATVPSDT